MEKKDRAFVMLASAVAVISAVIKVATVIFDTKRSEPECDWYCDNCEAYMNEQSGFREGGTWICAKCGYLNDVSSDNIVPTHIEEDEYGRPFEVIDIPDPLDWEGPEDY